MLQMCVENPYKYPSLKINHYINCHLDTKAMIFDKDNKENNGAMTNLGTILKVPINQS